MFKLSSLHLSGSRERLRQRGCGKLCSYRKPRKEKQKNSFVSAFCFREASMWSPTGWITLRTLRELSSSHITSYSSGWVTRYQPGLSTVRLCLPTTTSLIPTLPISLCISQNISPTLFCIRQQ